jgi:hypothetical protein
MFFQQNAAQCKFGLSLTGVKPIPKEGSFTEGGGSLVPCVGGSFLFNFFC